MTLPDGSYIFVIDRLAATMGITAQDMDMLNRTVGEYLRQNTTASACVCYYGELEIENAGLVEMGQIYQELLARMQQRGVPDQKVEDAPPTDVPAHLRIEP